LFKALFKFPEAFNKKSNGSKHLRDVSLSLSSCRDGNTVDKLNRKTEAKSERIKREQIVGPIRIPPVPAINPASLLAYVATVTTSVCKLLMLSKIIVVKEYFTPKL